MKKFMASVMILAIIFITASGEAQADWRRYVWTYEYQTLPKGKGELEYYQTFEVEDLSQSNVNEIQYQPEIEHGITDHWDVSVYNRWKTDNVKGDDDSTRYQGFKIRTRYRIGEKGKFWVDPLLYLEWITDVQRQRNKNKLEAKFIVAKDIGRWNVAYNQIIEARLGGRVEHNYAAGVHYKLFPGFTVGMESKGNIHKPGGHGEGFYLGPTASFAYKKFWIAGGFAFGLNNSTRDMDVRIIVGYQF